MLDSFRIESASVSDRGLSKKRPQNEDSFLEIPKSGIFAVADGVGGAEAGEVASQMAVEILAEAFVNETELSDAEQVMRSALEKANSAIHRMSNELPQLSSMATTIVALHVAGNIATIGHAGDSRLYRLDSDGNLYRETEDHSMVADEVRAGRMTSEQAENHPGKNIISRALGAEPTVEVDLKTIMVGPDTTFLICSDGVTRHVGDNELADLLRSGAAPSAICSQIKDLCFERGAEDNLTAVIVKLTEASRNDALSQVSSDSTPSDEITVASARTPVAVKADDRGAEQLLELETAELMPPAVSQAVRTDVPETQDFHDTIEQKFELPRNAQPDAEQDAAYAEYETSAAIPVEGQVLQSPDARSHATSITYGDSEQNATGSVPEVSESRTGVVGKIAGWVALLLVGSLIGLASYHYFLANRTPETIPQPITEMRSSNQQLTAFEDNRRSLDKDPEAALKLLINEPKEAENSFLIGRAYLLTARYPEARKAFGEALDLIAAGKVDPNNAKTIQKDISIAMTIVNDPLAQKNFKKELEDPKIVSTPAASGSQSPTR